YSLTSAHTNPDLQEIQAEMAPKFAAHYDKILLNKQLFERVKAVYDQKDELDLDDASQKLLEDTYKDFIRAGANLSEADQERIKEINKEISSLTTKFQENLLKMTKERAIFVDSKEELAGLSESRIAAAKEA